MAILTQTAKQKLSKYKAQFLRVFPNTGKKLVGAELVDMTDSEWVDEVVKQWLVGKLKRGERLLKDSSTQDYNDIE